MQAIATRIVRSRLDEPKWCDSHGVQTLTSQTDVIRIDANTPADEDAVCSGTSMGAHANAIGADGRRGIAFAGTGLTGLTMVGTNRGDRAFVAVLVDLVASDAVAG